MMQHTAEEIADVLDRAHDEVLVRGWTQGQAMDGEGRVCIYGAIAAAMGIAYLENRIASEAETTIRRFVGMWPGAWNDAEERTIDDVLDAFRVVAKRLRNHEIDP